MALSLDATISLATPNMLSLIFIIQKSDNLSQIDPPAVEQVPLFDK